MKKIKETLLEQKFKFVEEFTLDDIYMYKKANNDFFIKDGNDLCHPIAAKDACLHGKLHARRVKIRAVGHKADYPVGVFQRKQQCDIAAVGKPEHMGFFDTQFVHKIV